VSVFPSHWKIVEYVLNENSVPTNQIKRSHNPDLYNSEYYYCAFSVDCITVYYKLNMYTY